MNPLSEKVSAIAQNLVDCPTSGEVQDMAIAIDRIADIEKAVRRLKIQLTNNLVNASKVAAFATSAIAKASSK